jgi:hypothetical protein
MDLQSDVKTFRSPGKFRKFTGYLTQFRPDEKTRGGVFDVDVDYPAFITSRFGRQRREKLRPYVRQRIKKIVALCDEILERGVQGA